MDGHQRPTARPAARRHHRIAASFDSEADANEAIHDLRPLAQQVHVVVHQAGCHEVDEAERQLAITIGRCVVVATPLSVLAFLAFGAVFRSPLGELSTGAVVAIAIGPGAILGILLGGILGIALSQNRLMAAQARSHGRQRTEEEVLVATVERGSLHNPVGRLPEYERMRTSEIVDDLETQIRRVFENHHGHLIDA